MKLRHYMWLPFFGLALCACQTKDGSKPAHLRLLSTIQYTSAKVTINGKNKQGDVHKTLRLKYGQPTEYQQLSPGYYDITVSVEGKALLQGTYAMGTDGYYTLLATGLMPEKWTVNPQTTLYHLKHVFASEELHSANKYLPQWLMMRDNYGGSTSSGYLRLVNANPHTPGLTIKKKKSAMVSGLAYPRISDMIKLKPGNHTLQAYYGNIKLGQKTISIEPGYIYTAIICNNKEHSGKLSLRILKNPSRALLNSK